MATITYFAYSKEHTIQQLGVLLIIKHTVKTFTHKHFFF